MRREKRRHHDLEVWSDAVDLVEEVYRVTASFPPDERFGLTSQLRRSSVSVPSNIAEGCARRTRAELLQFLYVARGSLAEMDTQVEITRRLGYLADADALQKQIDRVFAKLGGLINSLKTTP